MPLIRNKEIDMDSILKGHECDITIPVYSGRPVPVTPEQQWENDVLEFGDDAYKHWHIHGIHDYPNNVYSDPINNAHVAEILDFSLEDVAERKPC